MERTKPSFALTMTSLIHKIDAIAEVIELFEAEGNKSYEEYEAMNVLYSKLRQYQEMLDKLLGSIGR